MKLDYSKKYTTYKGYQIQQSSTSTFSAFSNDLRIFKSATKQSVMSYIDWLTN